MGKTLRLAKNTDFKAQNGTNLPVIKDAVSSTIRYTTQIVDRDELRLRLIIWVTTQGAILRIFLKYHSKASPLWRIFSR